MTHEMLDVTLVCKNGHVIGSRPQVAGTWFAYRRGGIRLASYGPVGPVAPSNQGHIRVHFLSCYYEGRLVGASAVEQPEDADRDLATSPDVPAPFDLCRVGGARLPDMPAA